jgi:hypothetical protein
MLNRYGICNLSFVWPVRTGKQSVDHWPLLYYFRADESFSQILPDVGLAFVFNNGRLANRLFANSATPKVETRADKQSSGWRGGPSDFIAD